MALPFLMKIEKNLKLERFSQFYNFYRFLAIEVKAFEAGDFLNIFLRFWGF